MNSKGNSGGWRTKTLEKLKKSQAVVIRRATAEAGWEGKVACVESPLPRAERSSTGRGGLV